MGRRKRDAVEAKMTWENTMAKHVQPSYFPTSFLDTNNPIVFGKTPPQVLLDTNRSYLLVRLSKRSENPEYGVPQEDHQTCDTKSLYQF
jgi:hypothetical protein